MKRKWSFFRWTPVDWLSSQGVRMMDATQRGWYIQLLCEAWEMEPQNRLPDDDLFLQRLAGAESSEPDFQSRWDAVKKMFPAKDGFLHNLRLERELEECEGASLHGKNAAVARWKGNPRKPKQSASNAHALPEHQMSINRAMPNGCQSVISNQESVISNQNAFAKFWGAYPKKVSKPQAEKAFKMHGCAEIIDLILASLNIQKASQDWTKENGKYIPYPASWLNGRRWEDQAPVQSAVVPQTTPANRYGLEQALKRAIAERADHLDIDHAQRDQAWVDRFNAAKVEIARLEAQLKGAL